MNYRKWLCLLTSTILIGCAGSSDSGSGSADNTPPGGSSGGSGRAVKIEVRTRLSMSQTNYDALKAQGQSQFTNQGYTFEDGTHTVLGPAFPLASALVTAGGVTGMTDSTGLVKLPDFIQSGSEATVKKNLSDTDQLTFASSKIGSLDNPSKVVLERTVDAETFLENMDDEAMHMPMTRDDDEDYGTDCGHANTCCLDYDGIISSDKKPKPIHLKLLHFPGSTCAYWVGQFVCAKLTGTDEGVCFSWHQGRWCQQIDDSDFSATPSRTQVSVGDTVDIAVHNNTRLNEVLTQLTTPEGSLECTTVAGGGTTGSSVNCAFYEAGPVWHPDRTVTFHAPTSLPNGVDKIVAKIRFNTYGGAKDVFIEVCQ